MRTPIIAGNWKMNATLEGARQLVREMLPSLEGVQGVERVICPPFIALAAIVELLRGSSVAVGAQNMHYQEKGAYTGEVSPLMLKGLCQFVILGHSERRQHFGETDEVINLKVKAAQAHGLRPILCVGERLEEREGGRAQGVVAAQLRGCLNGVPSANGLVVAYEPVWAIGTGRAASGQAANDVMAFIRQEVGVHLGNRVAQETPLLYGGSVTSQNIAEFVGQPHIDGALVGGASLKAQEFVEIARITARMKAGE